jgi:N-methylhydantoinase A
MGEGELAGAGKWRIGVDVGGTFTDLVLAGAHGEVRVCKVPSVPEDPGQGVLDALGRAAEILEADVSALLAACEVFVHGSTVATNIVVERKGARVGLLTTEGFRDSLEIRRGMRPDPWRHREPYTAALVPRRLRLPIPGRIAKDGGEAVPLDHGSIAQAARMFEAAGVESVAVCFFNSFLNDAHEHAATDGLAEALPRRYVCASADVAPIMGEYERTSTVVMNAYVAPRTVGYLQALDRTLAERGLRHPMLLIQNNGGALSVRQVAERPVTLLLSGPAAGVGSLTHCSALTGSDNLISMEIGGTSCDVILMAERRVPLTDRLEIDDHHLALPSVDVHTIGAGGGTIAGVDAAGLLFVGPQGAGARPGPACYGLGGTEPTVTDAQLVLGRLAPGPYADGAVTLDQGLAHDAIRRRLAEPLGLDVAAAATGVIQLMEQKLLHAVQRISVERGHDPRRFVLAAAGGAGPLHGVSVARLLGCREVYVPRLAGAYCALGMLHSDVRHDFVRVHLAALETADPEAVAAILSGLRTQAEAALATAGFAPADMEFRQAYDLRYRAQQWDIQVALDGDVFDAAALRAGFEREHERLFGHIQPGGAIEITKVRLAGIGRMPALAAPRVAAAGAAAPMPTGRRRVWLGSGAGWVEAPVYKGAALGPGAAVEGPALVDEQTTTLLIGEGDRLSVDEAGNYKVVIHG